MKFSVIIPTYNDWNRLMQCLDALQKQTIDQEQFEVIVVDNSLSPQPSNLELPGYVKLTRESKPGSYVARNTGAAMARGDVLAFTDSDCIPDKNWLADARKLFEQTDCDLVGGRVDIFQAENGNKYGYMYERLTAFQQYRNVPEGKSVTANLFVKKSVFEQSGGFDDSIKSGGDWEFTLRCTEKGYHMVYGDDVLVFHPARDLYTIFKKQRRLTCGGALNVKNKYGHSYLRIMVSHLLHGLQKNREYLTNPSRREKVIVFSIDLIKYIYRTVIYWGLVFRVINPEKVRE